MRKFYNLLIALSVTWCATMPLQSISAENPKGLTVATQAQRAALKKSKLDKKVGFVTADNYLPQAFQSTGMTCFNVPAAQTAKVYQMPSVGSGSYFKLPLRKAELEAMSTYNAVVTYSTSDAFLNDDNEGYGFYSFAPFSSEAQKLRTHDELCINAGGTYIGNNEYFCSAYESSYGYIYITHFTFNTTTWRMTGYVYGHDIGTIARDLAYDPDTQLCYGVSVNNAGDGYAFSSINPRTYDATSINADIPEAIFAITFDDEGQLFGVGNSGTLYKIDKFTGEMTAIGDTGVTSSYATGGCYDPANGTMLVGVMEYETSSLYSINLQTAEATKIYDFANHEEIVGPWVPRADAADLAPAAPEDLTVSFPEGALTGTVTFTMPSECYDGSDLDGDMKYVVKFNGHTAAEGTAGAGEEVSIEHTVDVAGTYVVVVYAVNDAGESVRTPQTLYIGGDLPKDIASVNIKYEDGSFVLSWNTVTESENGGYFDPSKITYKITRFCNDALDGVVATNVTDTIYADPVAVPDNISTYFYQVAQIYDGQTLNATETAYKSLGAATPDFKVDFRYGDTSYYTNVLDANNDGITWQWVADTDNTATYMGMMQLSATYRSAKDDYLFTCPMKLEAGREYRFETKLEQSNKYTTAQYEILVATSPTAEGVVRTLVEPTYIMNGESVVLSLPFTMQEAGEYYIGIHSNMSNRFGLNCYYMNVLRGPMAAAPYSPELTVVTNVDGEVEAECSVSVPTMSVAGDDLADEEDPVTSVVVTRGDTEVYRNDNPTAGAVYTFTDTPAVDGEYTYTAVASNSAGEGYTKSITTYVGIALPNHPTGAVGYQTSTVGQVNLTWDEVTTDVYGSQRDPSLVYYSIASQDSGSWEIFEDEVDTPPYVFTATSPTAEQAFHNYLVLANSDAGINTTGSATGLIPVGKPYDAPFVEPFQTTSLATIIAVSKSNSNGYWQLTADENDADGNGGYMRYHGYNGDIARIQFGLMNINCDEPELRYYVYNGASSSTKFTLQISTDGNTFVPVQSDIVANSADGWVKYTYDLSAYKDQVIRIGFTTEINGSEFRLDNLSVKPKVHNNLIVKGITAPESTNVDEPVSILTNVYNDGANEANFTAELYCNDKCIESKEITELAADESVDITFEHTPNLFDADVLEYYVKVLLDGDENEDDNTSKIAAVLLKRSTLPGIADLTDNVDGTDRTLTWSAPQFDNTPEMVTDDVESYPAFSIGSPTSEVEDDSIGDWTAVSADESERTYGEWKSYPNRQAPFAVIVMRPGEIFDFDSDDEDDIEENSYYLPHSGDQYFAMYDHPDDSDDYLISPLLSGKEQHVSFFARTCGYDDYGEETLQFMYSTTGKDPEDFIQIDEDFDVPYDWTEYEFDLPDGAKYFAIHNISCDIWAVYIDDITYEAAPASANYVIEGYNLYCNGAKLNDEVITDNSYIIPLNADVNRTYYVTVMYAEKGESDLSNAVVIEKTTGLDAVSAEQVSVMGGKGEIIVRGAAGKDIYVYAADGKTIAAKNANATVTRLQAATGVYVVNVNNRIFKVVVR